MCVCVSWIIASKTGYFLWILKWNLKTFKMEAIIFMYTYAILNNWSRGFCHSQIHGTGNVLIPSFQSPCHPCWLVPWPPQSPKSALGDVSALGALSRLPWPLKQTAALWKGKGELAFSKHLLLVRSVLKTHKGYIIYPERWNSSFPFCEWGNESSEWEVDLFKVS